MKAALQGIRVIDFTGFASGPLCSMLLGDFGADVIKVEPLSGEGSRKWGVTRCGPLGDMSSLFAAVNRNKRGIALDLKSARGLELAYQLIADADVVLGAAVLRGTEVVIREDSIAFVPGIDCDDDEREPSLEGAFSLGCPL